MRAPGRLRLVRLRATGRPGGSQLALNPVPQR
jgi:hypothetical protein